MIPFLIPIFALFGIPVAIWASSWNRSGCGFFILSAIFSPILSALILLSVGKNEEKDITVVEKSSEVVKVRCQNCNELAPEEADHCPSCGEKLETENE